ncbi:MAG: hypothetical protein WBQ26_05330 [Gemmatimonadaceae bacterium]|nr:hypothetical protein [Gemmatimonadaceae bacterium]
MVNARAGRSSLGCLFMLLLLAAGIYFGLNIGEAYWQFYQYEDAMKQELRFNSVRPDSLILAHLWLQADSLDLPEDAKNISIERDPRDRTIKIFADYTELIELPLTVRAFSFHPHAEDTY